MKSPEKKPRMVAQPRDAATARLPVLEEQCEICEGIGGSCRECDGRGYIPTDAGERVLRLVRRHLIR